MWREGSGRPVRYAKPGENPTMATVSVCAVISSTTSSGVHPASTGHLVEVRSVECTGKDDETSPVVSVSPAVSHDLCDEVRQLRQPGFDVISRVVEAHHDGGQSPDDVVQSVEARRLKGPCQ